MKPYVPISCSFYDELEALATLQRNCEIVFTDDDGNGKTLTGIIKTFFIRDKVEFLQLETGEEIRLDKLASVNGKILPPSS